MRLTKQGWVYLTNSLQIEKHTFKLSEAIRPKTLLQLERYIQYPYYVHTLKEISIFDESTAVMLILNSNNLQKYLDDLEKHQ